MGIKNSVAVVTGASSGIGAALALELARRGAKVGLTARRLDRLEALAETIRSAGGIAAVEAADASDPESTRHALAKLAETLGPIDLLVANAGSGLADDAIHFSSERFARMTQVNLIGPAVAFESVLPSMLARKTGHLVGISSLAAYRGLPGSAGYSATKAGLSALLEGLRPELRPLGITVTTVHPGFVTTAMIEGARHPKPFEMSAERAARIIADGIERRRCYVDFPWPMVAVLGMIRRLPAWLFDRLAPLFNPPRRS